MTNQQAGQCRACINCGEPGALLFTATKGEHAPRLLRWCAECLRGGDWWQYGLEDRAPRADLYEAARC